MIDQTLASNAELMLNGVIEDSAALFEQYEPANDAEFQGADRADFRSVPDTACENLYATPW